jgi:signal transduction histidine kinase
MTSSKTGPNVGGDVETWFAPTERLDDAQLQLAVQGIRSNPILDALLWTFGGVVAVLNPQRQILAVNDALLVMLGLEEVGAALGLRPGEAINCVHADDHPGGCGTGRFCTSCGVANALVACQADGKPKERECVITVRRDGAEVELNLMARACPVGIGDQTLILLILEDVSESKRRESLTRTFLHDFANTVTALLGTAELLVSDNSAQRAVRARNVRRIAYRLAREVEIQRTLLKSDPTGCPVERRDVDVHELVGELGELLSNHPARQGRTLLLNPGPANVTLTTDPSLALRVLTNMVVNALEASHRGGEVRLDVEQSPGRVVFRVWNETAIPEAVAPRIFQRYFTTKSGAGRGLGTHAMKLIGEQYLGGKVGFHSAEGEGTTFRFALPAD